MSRGILIFWQLSVNISKTVKIEIYLQWKTREKSYMAYQMAATAMTLNDLEGRSQVEGLSNAIRRTFVQHFTRFQLMVQSRSLC